MEKFKEQKRYEDYKEYVLDFLSHPRLDDDMSFEEIANVSFDDDDIDEIIEHYKLDLQEQDKDPEEEVIVSNHTLYSTIYNYKRHFKTPVNKNGDLSEEEKRSYQNDDDYDDPMSL